VPYLLDDVDAWRLRSDGTYDRVEGGRASAQQALVRRYDRSS